MDNTTRHEKHARNCQIWGDDGNGLHPERCNCEPVIAMWPAAPVLDPSGKVIGVTPKVFYGYRDPRQCH